ncbi:MAG: hypothetical protein GC151_05025 [Betaproteobacteria bacterium]|nr:hypothetical protein [Betaproteobacteria bacterium]
MRSRLHDHPRLRDIVHVFVEQLDEKAGAIETAASDGDFESLAMLAHWLKGAGGTAGFDAFTGPARTLEALARSRDHAGVRTTVAELLAMTRQIEVPGGDTDGARHAPAG